MRKFARFCLRGCVAAVLMLACGTACRAQQASSPVTSSATATDAASPDATTISSDEITTLPVESRDWESLQQLNSQANDATPAGGTTGDVEAQAEDGNARLDTTSADTNTSGESYAGQSPTQNAVALDGFSAQQNFRSGPRGGASGGAASGSTFSQGAVGSLSVMPRMYSAAYGNAAGAVLAIQSRSGSAALHGGATLLFRESAFDAANPFSIATSYHDGAITSSVVKPENSMLQMAAHVGLPLGDWLGERFRAPRLRKRLVMFASYEEELKNDPVVSSPATVSFYALTPTQTDTLGTRGVSTAQITTALNYIDSLTGTVPRSTTRGLGFLRLDETLNKRDRVALTYAVNRFHSPAGAGFSSASDAVMARSRASVGDSFIAIDAMAAHWQHAFSTRIENALRFQFVRDDEREEPRAPLAQEPAIGPGGYAPQVTIQPEGFAYGTPSSLGRSAYPDEQRIELAESFDVLMGRHHFTLGGSWSRIHDVIASTTNTDGSFSYDSTAAGGLVDWITDYTFGVHAYPNGGCPSIHAATHYFCFHSFTQSFGATQSEFTVHDFAGYAEDSFRARHDLTLTFGARYEYTLLPFPQQPNFVLDEDLQAAAVQLGAATSSFPEDRNNIAPRVSVAWSPHGLMTARLGYGFFYGRLPGATVNAALTDTAMSSSTTRIRITPKTEVDCPQVAMQGFGYPCDFVSAPPAAVTQTTSSVLFAKNFRLPVVQRASLTLEHTFGKRAFIHAEYAMALTTQLPSTTDLNIAPATAYASFVLQGGAGHPGIVPGETFSVPLYIARRLTQYGPVSALVSNANSTYHAGTIEAEMRETRGFSMHASFTFSRAIDYAPLQSATPQTDGQFDPFTNGYDKGLSSLQFPFRFSGNVNWRSHFASRNGLQQRLFQNWRVSAIGTAGSGAPYSYNIFGGTELSGGRETINGSGGATYLPTIGRNTLRLPARGNVNLRLERSFEPRHGLRLEVFAEAFNLLNERNLSRVETRAFLLGTPSSGVPTPLVFQDAATIVSEGLNTSAFGSPTSSTTSLSRERQAELGIKLEF